MKDRQAAKDQRVLSWKTAFHVVLPPMMDGQAGRHDVVILRAHGVAFHGVAPVWSRPRMVQGARE